MLSPAIHIPYHTVTMTEAEHPLERELETWYPKIFRMVTALTYGTGMDADDITQDVFLKAWKKSETYNGESSLGTWLYTIARNTVMDAHRKRRVRSLLSFFKQQDDGETVEPVDPSPDRTDADELKDILRRTITSLDEPYRSILILREVEELTYADISAITGTPEGTLKSRLFYAKRILRERLTKLGVTP